MEFQVLQEDSRGSQEPADGGRGVRMPLQFTVLASGSSGNASLLQADEFGILLDAGLGSRTLARRLEAVGISWNQIHAVLLTHIHTDHWKDTTFAQLVRRRIPLYCHVDHQRVLRMQASTFGTLQAENLIRDYAAHQEFVPAPGLRCRPLPIRHDGGPTFGFRFEASANLFGHAHALAYVADLGSWDDELALALADVDLLALEFNHDVAMEYASGRSPYLIARVLGEEGHLSNAQAAGLLRAALRRSTPGRLRHVVQLHLSRECNRPALAAEAARAALAELAAEAQLHTASQDEPGPTLVLGGASNGTYLPRPYSPRAKTAKPARKMTSVQPWLPGMEM
jgi:phosphoribosyl 1,2-cyclic phosphodiesterase